MARTTVRVTRARRDQLVARLEAARHVLKQSTSNVKSKCPACAAKRLHAADERQRWHPLAGHGFVRGLGWTHLALAAEALTKDPDRTPLPTPTN